MRRWRWGAGIVAAVLPATLTAAACETGGEGDRVIVFAAASLAGAFEEIEERFEATHPDVDLEVHVAGSGALRLQILEGASADVVVTAGTDDVDVLADAGRLAGEPRIVATNVLALAVPEGNPAGVQGLEDLERPQLLVGLCSTHAPCGRLAREVLGRAGVEPAPDTEEPDVAALAGKLAAGELDVGLVYRSDVRIRAGLEEIPFPHELQVSVPYPAAALDGAPHPGPAADLLDHLETDEARDVLANHGFTLP